ncbi:MAG: glycosyltransferase [Verrucomicrobia bacterium]|nr:glycosyltransferase [Verrucomicrobiota bacterium]
MTVFSNPTVTRTLDLAQHIAIRDFSSPVRSKAGRILWDQWGVCRAARRAGHEWLFLPKGFSPFLRRPPVKLAAYVHDLMGEHYHRHHRGYEPRLEYEYFARCLAATLQHATVVFTNTDCTRRDVENLARHWNLPVPRVVTAGYGFDAPGLRDPAAKENRVLLFASKVPHKLTGLALRFLSHWLETRRFDGQIDCIGILSPDMERPTSPAWNWIGRVPPARSRELIRRARVVVYASEYEGFGMPPVEAVMEGTCPLYSNLPPLREVMGDAGQAFSNDSADSFVAAMDRALSTPPETIAGWSRELLARHNWPAVTRRIVDGLTAAG